MDKQKKEITIGYLFGVFKKAFIVMMIAAIVFGAAGVLYAKLISKPSYEATSAFWINNTSSGSAVSSSQTTAASSVAESCVELAVQDLPLRTAVRNHGLIEVLGCENENECVKKLASMVTAYKEEKGSAIFYVTVKADSPDKAYAVITAIETVLPEIIRTVHNSPDKGEFVFLINEIGSEDNIKTNATSAVKLGIICALAAMIVVFIVYLILNILDNAVYNEETLKDNFNYPVLGNIPTWHTKEEIESGVKRKSGNTGVEKNTYSEKLIGPGALFHVNEAFNSLRTNIIYAAASAKNPVFVVTGDSAGVGKSVISANLALSIANLSKRVLLVECDMRCPSLFKIFGKKSKNGLSELLAGIVENYEEVVMKHGETGLDIIFSGKIPPNPSELLAGQRMPELVEEWKKSYDYIILDMPPLASITDAAVVAPIVTGYILTVRCNHSNIKDIETVERHIKSANGNVIGFIMNDVKPKVFGRYGEKYASKYYGVKNYEYKED